MLPPFGAFEFPYPKTCYIYASTGQSIAPNTLTVISFDSKLWDTYGLFTGGSSGYITIPEDGLYLITARVSTTAVLTAPLGARIYRNGSYAYDHTFPPNNVVTIVVPLIYMYMMNKGDTLDLRVLWYGSSNINIDNWSLNTFMQVLKMPYITKGY